MAKKRKAAPGKKIKVEDYRHDSAKRKNIPPAKIAAEGTVPAVPKVRYEYNPHLPPVLRFDQRGEADKLPELIEKARRQPLSDDEAKLLAEALRNREPWLEWTGKREAKYFEVDPVALHIHERVSAQAILKVARRQDVARTLFGDPEQEYHEAVQFYRHDVDWTNRLILGDSLEVMSSLTRRENLAGKVQMIYIDPPYGIRFASNFQAEVGNREVKDRDQDLTREPEMIKAYRDTWSLGIHSYLSYLRDRLVVAGQLLSESGSIFVQINDENLHLVRDLLDEVFGRNNFVLSIVLKKKGAATPTDPVNDYILWYAKSRPRMRVRGLQETRKAPEDDPKFNTLVDRDGAHSRLVQIGDGGWNKLLQEGAVPARVNYPLVSQDPDRERSQDFNWRGRNFKCGEKRHWTYDPKVDMHRLAKAERVFSAGGSAAGVVFWSDWPCTAMSNIWVLHGDQDPRYVVQTNRTAIARCMQMTTEPGDLVLDPTCGSGSTAYVAEELGRRWITVDTSRVAVAIARQWLLTATFDRYRVNGEAPANDNEDPAGIDPHPGFVCRTVPRITLKGIAKNRNLDPIFAKHEPILRERLATCNRALKKVSKGVRQVCDTKLALKEKDQGKRSITDADRRRWLLPASGKWEHWEVPFDTDDDWPEDLQKAVRVYRKAWRAKMDEVNACIAANAEQEELVDQPEVVKGVARVSGPFTVEAVQPPEMSLGDTNQVAMPAVEDGLFDGEPGEMQTFNVAVAESYADTQNIPAYLDKMIRLLRNDGVRFPNNREMQFSRLEPIYGENSMGLHAEGRWHPTGKEDDDPEGPAAVCVVFGPQYGPVTALQVEDAIRSTNRAGHDDLVVAGFSFDGPAQAVIEEAQHPKLRIHMAHIRPDVNPGMDGLLKEQPKSQLFTVFGQPRTRLEGPDGEDQYVVHMDGVDIYNPVDNSIMPTGAEKVAAWFVDSDYDGRTFCITQAFFPDRSAWTKLARALKGVVDEDRFDALSGTTSLPFPAGEHKRVAVKVIDPRGNEVMRVHQVGG